MMACMRRPPGPEELRSLVEEKRIAAVIIGLLETRQTDSVMEKCLQIMDIISEEGACTI